LRTLSTPRLLHFRECIHSVSVFQGHQDAVTSAIFSRDDLVISGSDDKSVRIWDLRNMRHPLASIHADSSVNRLSISSGGLIAVPFDNRNVRLYDANGQRVGRLPRSARQGHTRYCGPERSLVLLKMSTYSRMVCGTAWSDDTKPNLFTCGFDRITFGWSVQQNENLKENDSTVGTTSLSSNAAPSSGPASLEGAKYLPRNGKDVNATLKESNLTSH
jgi:WD40 repeat protein